MTLPDQVGATTRRDFLQGSLGVAGTILTPSLSGLAADIVKPVRPNLVFIYTEGQRADALSIAGNTILKTPNQDRIGREGMRFTNAFCTNALCAPARATALTGLYSKTTGATTNQDPNTQLPAAIPLFTDILREAGYEVAIVGKVHVKNGVKERYWDYYFGFNAPVTNYYNPHFSEGRKGVIGEEKVYQNSYADDLATDRALAWLREKREKPFCLLLWLQAPHSPFYRARRHLDLYNGVTIPKPATFDDDMKGYPGKPKAFVDAENKIGTTVAGDAARSLEELVKDYYAGLVDVDENIGRLYQHLEKSGELDDTAILQTSDHGYFLGEWRFFDKRFMHEPSIRVPMMLRYPKRIRPGVTREEMVLDVDIAPTLLDLAGINKPEDMQGKSIVGLASADDLGWRKDWFYEYYEYPGYEQVRPHRGIRSERYKLIYYYLDPQEFELYDLVHDPGETVNLYGDPEHSTLQQNLWNRLQSLQAQIPEHQMPPRN
jgi:arylsulfatase A-like enzyme